MASIMVSGSPGGLRKVPNRVERLTSRARHFRFCASASDMRVHVYAAPHLVVAWAFTARRGTIRRLQRILRGDRVITIVKKILTQIQH